MLDRKLSYYGEHKFGDNYWGINFIFINYLVNYLVKTLLSVNC